MPQIIPIKELKNTAEISELCHRTDGPVYITKNGYGDMVIMSMKAYEEKMYLLDVYVKLADAEEEVRTGQVTEARQVLKSLRAKHGL